MVASPPPRGPVVMPSSSAMNPAASGTADSVLTIQYGCEARTESIHGVASCHRPACTRPAAERSTTMIVTPSTSRPYAHSNMRAL
jgi:hypothetical protein